MAELGRVRNRVRMGRIARIEKDRVVFHSNQVDPSFSKTTFFEAFLLFQEIPTSTQTLHINCSAAGIKMEEGKKIFNGSTINIHWFMLPPPGYNTSVMVALELLHPE